jgi:hypothetical protein
LIRDFRSFHSDRNAEKFNEDLIYNKENESILTYLDPICKTLEIIPEIKYLGSSIEPINTVYKFNKAEKNIDIEKSELQLIKMSFKISKEEKEGLREEEIHKYIYFPKLIDSQYFIINGNRYYPIYQMLDSGTYRTNKALTLKTLLMPIVLREKKESFDDINGNTHNMLSVDLDLFRNKIPFLIYFFSKFGYEETIEYFGLEDTIHILMKEDLDQLDEEELEDNVIFMITKNISLVVDKTYFNESKNNQLVVGTLLNCFNTRIKVDKIYEQDYWIKKLGGYFTTNNSNKQEKGEGILLSFERILDEWTKKILRTEEKNKQDTYSVVRWMATNYLTLAKQDNMNLANKRIRLYEYLLHPLLIKFSKGTYRVLNNRNAKFEKIKTIFSNIPKGFLVKKIINNELLRYDNSVNSISLFSTILRFTQSGPQSPFSSSNVNIRYRGLHPSYLGRLGLTSTSAGDPGVSGSLTPFLELPKGHYMHFTERPEVDLTLSDEAILEQE